VGAVDSDVGGDEGEDVFGGEGQGAGVDVEDAESEAAIGGGGEAFEGREGLQALFLVGEFEGDEAAAAGGSELDGEDVVPRDFGGLEGAVVEAVFVEDEARAGIEEHAEDGDGDGGEEDDSEASDDEEEGRMLHSYDEGRRGDEGEGGEEKEQDAAAVGVEGDGLGRHLGLGHECLRRCSRVESGALTDSLFVGSLLCHSLPICYLSFASTM
jgi:hypothetical protein